MRPEAFQDKIKGIKGKKGLGVILIGILSGILLLIVPSQESEDATVSERAMLTSAEYCTMLEGKAKNLLLQLPEVDDCEVFITLQTGYRYVYATDQHVREDSDSREIDKTIVLAGNGNGEEAILIEETMPAVAGVAVVCRDASYETQYRIIELMCALFDVKSNRISVQT